MELSGQIHIPAALLPMKEPSELGGPNSQSGHTEKQIHFDLLEDQTPDHPCCRLVTAMTVQFHLLRPDIST